ncbi:hypothetical protein [Bathymodiolus thermophilus thioautotrophic gill symbiont]|uniref:hypothetical protein n=1 Tax=Bathymodiolus thermophilus thioautotrophic gill symbiont TaxID=2360 RepID=UPI00192C9117|nr:hypothetical protein [Bathymodiolus thermophilus thioautotrophic gill symbiont]
MAISLKIFLAGLRLGLKNPQVGEKWVSDDGFYFIQRSLLLKRLLGGKFDLGMYGKTALGGRVSALVRYLLILLGRLDLFLILKVQVEK